MKPSLRLELENPEPLPRTLQRLAHAGHPKLPQIVNSYLPLIVRYYATYPTKDPITSKNLAFAQQTALIATGTGLDK